MILTPYRLYAEIAGGVLLIATITGWWLSHNRAEQKIGAQACIQATTETRAAAVDNTKDIEAAHAEQLRQVVGTYESKLDLASRNSADLAQRLHDSDAALRRSTVPSVGPAPVGVPSCEDDAVARRRDQQYADTLTACAANAIELNALRDAWIKEASKVGAPPPR